MKLVYKMLMLVKVFSAIVGIRLNLESMGDLFMSFRASGWMILSLAIEDEVDLIYL